MKNHAKLFWLVIHAGCSSAADLGAFSWISEKVRRTSCWPRLPLELLAGDVATIRGIEYFADDAIAVFLSLCMSEVISKKNGTK